MFIEAACGDDWSNFFVRFFTLNALPRESNCLWREALVAPPPSLSSRVLEAERAPGRVPLRTAAVGVVEAGCCCCCCFEGVPLPVGRAVVGVCRLGGRAGEAIASWVGEDSETRLAFAVCTPR